MRGGRRYASAVFAWVAGLAVGCGGDAARGGLPSFNDITSAPAAIQTAAAAVVRITTANAAATGSFISPSGLLLTNNHVLGAEVCPIEGCAVQLRFSFQRGHDVIDPVTVTAVPVAVDVGLDVAIVQISMGGSPLPTPDYLEIRGQDSTSLVGQHVTVVGHPESRLKKWTDGVAFDAFGDWFKTTAFSLPGNSGSPMLDDAGKLVGLLHRGPTTLDLITQDSVDVYSIGTSSASILAAQTAPLPPVMISLGAATTADKVVAENVVYQNGGARTAAVGASSVAVLDLLAQACDAALARTDFVSPDDLDNALQPCGDGQNWIECRVDATPTPYAQTCPDDSARAQWADRFRRMNQKWVEMNGNTDLFPVSFGIAALQTDHGAGQVAGAAEMLQALDAAQQPLDFSIANYLAAFAVDSYAGTRNLDWLRTYYERPSWARGAYSIASAFLWWRDAQAIDDTELLTVLERINRDPDIDVHAKLYIDMALYFRNH